MTSIAQQKAKEAQQLQESLQALSEEAQEFMRPTMNGLMVAANEELNDGEMLGDALPPALNAVTSENAEASAEAFARTEAQEALLDFAASIKRVFTTMTAPPEPGTLLSAEMVRYRVRHAADALHAATRREAILEGREVLQAMLTDYPNIEKALDGIEKAGEEAADKLDRSDLVMQLRAQARESGHHR